MGTELKLIENKAGDAFEVFDRRILRANEEISIGLAGQTMVFTNGSSLSQAEVHQAGFEMIINQMADELKYVVNGSLIPKMIAHGFPVNGLRFEWNDSYEYTPDEMQKIETMLLQHYDIDPKYFIDKYGITIIGKKEQPNNLPLRSFFD